jgi:hypothetical protein
MAAKTKEQLLMTDAEILGISAEETVETSSVEVAEPVVDSTPEEVSTVEVKEEDETKPRLPKPADATHKAVSPLELIKIRKSGNPLCSVSEIISSRKSGGRNQQTVQELIASRKSGQASGVTAMDIIAERKYSPKRQAKVL